jgi:hypothetical protein
MQTKDYGRRATTVRKWKVYGVVKECVSVALQLSPGEEGSSLEKSLSSTTPYDC